MLNKHIETALNHSPRHKGAMTQALIGVERSDIAGAAKIVKAKCIELRITDFPNPFPRETREFKIWNGVWSSDAPVSEPIEEAGPDLEPVDAPLIELPKGFAKLTKAQIEVWALENFGVNLDTDLKKSEMIDAVKALVAKQ